MKHINYTTIVMALGLLLTSAISFAGPDKVDLCHFEKDTETYAFISVSSRAAGKHIAKHGDVAVGSQEWMDLNLNSDCQREGPTCSGDGGFAYSGGGCWFLGRIGESCTTVCDNVARVYDDQTETVAGATDANDNNTARNDACFEILTSDEIMADFLACNLNSIYELRVGNTTVRNQGIGADANYGCNVSNPDLAPGSIIADPGDVCSIITDMQTLNRQGFALSDGGDDISATSADASTSNSARACACAVNP